MFRAVFSSVLSALLEGSKDVRVRGSEWNDEACAVYCWGTFLAPSVRHAIILHVDNFYPVELFYTKMYG